MSKIFKTLENQDLIVSRKDDKVFINYNSLSVSQARQLRDYFHELVDYTTQERLDTVYNYLVENNYPTKALIVDAACPEDDMVLIYYLNESEDENIYLDFHSAARKFDSEFSVGFLSISDEAEKSTFDDVDENSRLYIPKV